MHLTCLKVMPISVYCLLPITHQVPSYPRSAEKTERGLRARCRTQNGDPNSCLRCNCSTFQPGRAFWLWETIWIWGIAEFIAHVPIEKSVYITQKFCFHFPFLLNVKLWRPSTTVTFLLPWHKEKKFIPLMIFEVGKPRDAAFVHDKRLCATS